jgi:hypothetical protein
MAAIPGCVRPSVGPILLASLLALQMLGASPVFAGQQTTKSLGEIAREEAARRKAVADKTKTYTKDDLPKHAMLPPTAGSGGAAAPAAKPDAASGEKPAAAEAGAEEKAAGKAGDEKDEAWWRDRITKARDGLRRSQMFAQALQTRINALNADFNSRDNPIERTQIGTERATAVAELQTVQAEIKSIQQQILEIEDEARRANVPPGWLR